MFSPFTHLHIYTHVGRFKSLFSSLSPHLLYTIPGLVLDISCVSTESIIRVLWGRASELEDWIGKRRGEWADTAFSGGERCNDKCWMEFRHYYSGCILLHCSGTLTHIPNCTLPGFSISFVHFPSVYIIESLPVLMNIARKFTWAYAQDTQMSACFFFYVPFEYANHLQWDKLGLWCTIPLWLPPGSHIVI